MRQGRVESDQGQCDTHLPTQRPASSTFDHRLDGLCRTRSCTRTEVGDRQHLRGAPPRRTAHAAHGPAASCPLGGVGLPALVSQRLGDQRGYLSEGFAANSAAHRTFATVHDLAQGVGFERGGSRGAVPNGCPLEHLTELTVTPGRLPRPLATPRPPLVSAIGLLRN